MTTYWTDDRKLDQDQRERDARQKEAEARLKPVPKQQPPEKDTPMQVYNEPY